MKTAVFLTAAFALSFLLTGLLRRYALRVRMLDIPNARSSHTEPTPRGGGLAIVAVFILGVFVLLWQGAVAAQLVTTLLPSCILIASVGFLDDHYSVPAATRICAHLSAAGVALY
ncbi:MAG: glycosyl transferase, partial [Desulforhopalus sp.]